jgi:hypothetical protein
MPLSINPISTLTQKANSLVSNANQKGQGLTSSPLANQVIKANLDAKINKLAGGLGSGLGSNAKAAVTNLAKSVTSSVITGNPSNIQNSLKGVAAGALDSAIPPKIASLPGVGAVTQAIKNTIASGGLGGGATGSIAAAAGSKLAGIGSSIKGALGGGGGAVGDIMSAVRAQNIPNMSIDFGAPEVVVRSIPTEPGDWRVRIAAPPLIGGEIVFPVIPNMSLVHKANYTNTELVHTNYLFLAYKNSATDDISISCEWPVETLQDGAAWLDMVLLGRTLTKMFYGRSDPQGNPPPICTLFGFSTDSSRAIILPETPVVVKSFQIDLKDDVNYIEVDGNYVPRMSSVNITVGVIYNRNTQREFDLAAYRNGVSQNIRY